MQWPNCILSPSKILKNDNAPSVLGISPWRTRWLRDDAVQHCRHHQEAAHILHTHQLQVRINTPARESQIQQLWGPVGCPAGTSLTLLISCKLKWALRHLRLHLSHGKPGFRRLLSFLQKLHRFVAVWARKILNSSRWKCFHILQEWAIIPSSRLRNTDWSLWALKSHSASLPWYSQEPQSKRNTYLSALPNEEKPM